jgi:hypothetical protein
VSAAKRVARGVAFLDREEPGWEQRIVGSTLDVNSFQRCVLSQIYGSYREGRKVLHLLFPVAMIHGFWPCTPRDIHELNHAWLTVIESRLQAKRDAMSRMYLVRS